MNNEKSIKIFVDCHVFDDGFQGTRTYLQGIYEHLIKEDNFHFFLASNNSENLKAIFGAQQNITFVTYKYKNKFLRLLFDIPAIIKKHKIDYAHFQYIVAPIKKCKYIVTTHDLLFIDFPNYFPTLNRLINTFLYKLSLKSTDIKLTVSQYSKLKIENHFHFQDVAITPNAVNEVFYEAYDKAVVKKEVAQKFNLKKYIIYISRWEPRKNHQLVLKSFVELKLYKEYQLVFIGDSSIHSKEYFDFYDTLESRIQNQILSFQKTDFQTMLTLLRGADVSVYPSIAEGFGIPPLESVAARIPTLCSNTTAMSDFDFMNQFLFNPYDQEEFKQKLKLILETDCSEEMKRLSNVVKEKYNWKTSASVLKDKIIENKKGE